MSKTTTTTSSGISFAGMLTILFIGLKLGKVITWSWWWILSPLWISFALFLSILLIIIVGAITYGIFKARRPKKNYLKQSRFQERLNNLRK